MAEHLIVLADADQAVVGVVVERHPAQGGGVAVGVECDALPGERVYAIALGAVAIGRADAVGEQLRAVAVLVIGIVAAAGKINLSPLIRELVIDRFDWGHCIDPG